MMPAIPRQACKARKGEEVGIGGGSQEVEGEEEEEEVVEGETVLVVAGQERDESVACERMLNVSVQSRRLKGGGDSVADKQRDTDTSRFTEVGVVSKFMYV